MEKLTNVVLAHRNCADGHLAAYILYRKFKEDNTLNNSQFFFVQYGEEIQPIPDTENLWIVDFSYTYDQLKVFADQADKIVMLDHHETAADMWGGYKNVHTQLLRVSNFKQTRDSVGCNVKGVPLFIKLVHGESGAKLTYEQFYKECVGFEYEFMKNERLQKLIAAVNDYDLWKFELPDTKIIDAMIKSKDYSFSWIDELVECSEEKYKEYFLTAKAVVDYRSTLIDSFSRKASIISFAGYQNVAIVNCPSEFKNDVADRIYSTTDVDFVIIWTASTRQVFMSLRSKKGKVSVKEITAKFGCGGHENAAGMSLPIDKLEDFLNGKL